MTNTIEKFVEARQTELLGRARQGEAQAFCEVAREHEARLFRQAIALCQDPAVAEDLVAETLVEAWKSLARFDGKCRFSTWLYAILLHRYQKLVRSRRSRPVPLSALPLRDAGDRERVLEFQPDQQPSPADVLVRRELNAPLRSAIAALPTKHQQVLLLRFYEDASLPKIAAALGLSLGTVKSRLHYALEKLCRNESLMNLLRGSRDT